MSRFLSPLLLPFARVWEICLHYFSRASCETSASRKKRPYKISAVIFEALGSRGWLHLASYFLQRYIGSKEQRAVALILCIWPEAQKVASSLSSWRLWCWLLEDALWLLPGVRRKNWPPPTLSSMRVTHIYNIRSDVQILKAPAAPCNLYREKTFSPSRHRADKHSIFVLSIARSLSLMATRLVVAQCTYVYTKYLQKLLFWYGELRNTPHLLNAVRFILFVLLPE